MVKKQKLNKNNRQNNKTKTKNKKLVKKHQWYLKYCFMESSLVTDMTDANK